MVFSTPDIDTVRASALLLAPLVLGLLQHIMTEPPARSWHTKLNKSPYRPPPWVFPIVWIWSYLTLGYASHLVERSLKQHRTFLIVLGTLYSIHLALLTAWGFVFNALRRIDHGLNVILLIDMSAFVLLLAIWNIVPFAATLCIPYFLWLLHLTHLNIYMFRNNVTTHWTGITKQQVLRQHETPIQSSMVSSEPFTTKLHSF